ncbi:hypothetical protein [Aestuariivirga sp.]|uniref:hypothetical protein n=1 Tax=Aestuariivirga sp. TaxID=2650926 RepID=UPI00391D9C25
MRFAIFLTAAAFVLAPLPVLAYENFIPLGQNYAPDDDQLPPLGSAQDQINAQVDVYESEIYNQQRRQKVLDSRNQLLNQQNPGNIDENDLDY